MLDYTRVDPEKESSVVFSFDNLAGEFQRITKGTSEARTIDLAKHMFPQLLLALVESSCSLQGQIGGTYLSLASRGHQFLVQGQISSYAGNTVEHIIVGLHERMHFGNSNP